MGTIEILKQFVIIVSGLIVGKFIFRYLKGDYDN
jgi:hypothetical protein